MQIENVTLPQPKPRKQQRHRTYLTRSFGPLSASWTFVIGASFVWFCVNAFVVARPEGFDPFRYEYFAREGLPEDLLLATGYRIVILLQWLYEFLPYFFGFAVFCAVLHSALILTLRDRALLWALFNPITFYYIGQTGKDGIAILAFVAMAMLAADPGKFWQIFAGFIVITIAVIIRPPVAIFLPLIFFLFRHGPRQSLIASLVLGFGFLMVVDQADIADSLLDLVTRDDEADVNQSARGFTFGTGAELIAIRFVFYFLSIFFQPFIGIAKFLASFDFFLLYETLVYLAMLVLVVRMRLVQPFIRASLPFVALVAIIFPFYHFRYLAVTYPVVLAYLMARPATYRKHPARCRKRRLLRSAEPSIGEGVASKVGDTAV